jgi:hypothetical protein
MRRDRRDASRLLRRRRRQRPDSTSTDLACSIIYRNAGGNAYRSRFGFAERDAEQSALTHLVTHAVAYVFGRSI